jgi:hypothetical protein
MQKRQLRLTTPAQIHTRLAEFLTKKINIVLDDNTVLLAELLSVTANEITVKNMRQRKQKFLLARIYEINIDIDA